MKYLGLLVTFLWATGLLSAQGKPVSKPENRQELLDNVKLLLGSEPAAYKEISMHRQDPFSAIQPEPEIPAPVVAATADKPNTPAPAPVIEKPARLADEVALAAIARNFSASGSLIAGERRLLRLKNGKMAPQGTTFSARIKEELYVVSISRVTENGYTLSLGNASISRRFLDESFSSEPYRSPTPTDEPEGSDIDGATPPAE